MKKEQIEKELRRIDSEERGLKTDASNAHNTGHTDAEYECHQALAVLSQYRNKLMMKILDLED